MSLSSGFPGGSVVLNPPGLMQGTRIPSLVKDPICCRVTKPMCHNYWACALGAQELQLLKCALEPGSETGESTMMKSHTHKQRVAPTSTTREKPTQQWRPSIARNKFLKNHYKKGNVWHHFSTKTHPFSPAFMHISAIEKYAATSLHDYNIMGVER